MYEVEIDCICKLPFCIGIAIDEPPSIEPDTVTVLTEPSNLLMLITLPATVEAVGNVIVKLPEVALTVIVNIGDVLQSELNTV